MVRKLNILMSYPVKWTESAVIRDFIQNFYDALGYHAFSSGFHHDYSPEQRSITMWAAVSFDIEWLYYLGTSTKRKTGFLTAGKFGEGFKIASLIAYRDFSLSVEMESKDWRLKVGDLDDSIDGKPVKRLSYFVSDRIDDGKSVLTLKNVSPGLYAQFVETISDFYFPENKRFGKRIAIGEDFAVFHCASTDSSSKTFGYLYAAYQQRKKMNIPVIICDHAFQIPDDDRDRRELHVSDAVRSVLRVIQKLSPEESFRFLEALCSYWSGVSTGPNAVPVKDILRACLKSSD